MNRILIIFLFWAIYTFAMAQIYSERGYIVKGKSVYYSSTVYYPAGVALSKKAIRAQQKKDRREKGVLVLFADAKTFKNHGKGYGADCSNVFYRGDVISADPATFKTIDRWEYVGFDKKFFFREGKKLPVAIDGASFRHCQEYLYVDDNYAYVISDSSTYKIPVDGKTFEEIGRNSGKTVYEDKDNVNDYFESEFRKAISKKYRY